MRVYCPECERSYHEDELVAFIPHMGGEEMCCPECGAFEELEDIDDLIQRSFNEASGEMLSYLDEAGVSQMCKRAVKAVHWALCDRIKDVVEDM